MSTMMSERRSQSGLATVNEAAFVTGVSPRAVHQAIDRNEIRTYALRRAGDPTGRAVGSAELVYLRVYTVLSSKARKEVYRLLSSFDLDAVPPVIELTGAVRLDIHAALEAVRWGLAELDRVKSRIHADPEIRGGEPVFRGTRIPVYMIADFLREGVPRAEILEDYPSLDDEALEIAIRFAELYPRRGRPKVPPWRKQEPTHRFAPEELRG